MDGSRSGWKRPKASLEANAWRLDDATVVRQGDASEKVGIYYLATDLTAEDVCKVPRQPSPCPSGIYAPLRIEPRPLASTRHNTVFIIKRF